MEIGLPVPEKTILKGFYNICAWRPSWSIDLDAANKLSFPYPRRLHIKCDFDRASDFGEEGVCLSIVNDVDGRRRTNTGPCVYI